MGETPKRLVREHIFANDKKSGDKFLEVVKNADKDLIKSKLDMAGWQ